MLSSSPIHPLSKTGGNDEVAEHIINCGENDLIVVDDIKKLGKFDDDTRGKLLCQVKRILSFINQFSV